jgi:elongation factor P
MIITATRIRIGYILEIEGDPCKVMDMTHITPGKGNAVVQTKMRNLRTGTQFEQRFRSTETVKTGELDEHEMEYLYKEGTFFNFMNTETYEQIAVPEDVLGDIAPWLTDNMKIRIQFYNDQIVGASLPKYIDVQVVETTPYLRGATQSPAPKPAKLANGATISVPAFVEEGEMIRVDTENFEYFERVK